ncbi:MAG: succinate--CoA ligase subunit beta [Chloroflexi bacterium]|nr:succinate--CoA ligase subunit beta [Chloroflexota bacterium]
MDLFEYQGKQYFARYGIPVSPGGVAHTVDEAVSAADAAGYPVVIKAQVQVGGRGKAGGIKLASNSSEVRHHAGNILGMDIRGHVVERVWVERASDIKAEYYASFTLDRGARKHLAMVSKEGGVDIEHVAATNPDAIIRRHIDPAVGLTHADAVDIIDSAGIDQEARSGAVSILELLDGSVGIIANGAGLAMSTLDVVNQVGGTPANFLDIGGGASAAVMANALEVVNSDPNVKAIFINIFGGITRGEEVANGIVTALGRVTITSPIVVRLDGTNAVEGRAILKAHESNRLVSRPTMVEAAQAAVAFAAQ